MSLLFVVKKYNDLPSFQCNRNDFEKHYPSYAAEEKTSSSNDVWGACRLGRIPSFIYDDTKASRAAQATDFTMSDENTRATQKRDGAIFKERFNEVLQFFQSRCQHHIHPLATDKKTGKEKRVIPNACRAKNKPTECKHEAPWTNRVSPSWMTEPLIVCEGLAKRLKLRTSGPRNWMGQCLGMRNDAWLNGCTPGLCVAFAGSNSDIKINDRIPILDVF